MWIRENSIPVACMTTSSSQDMLHSRVWELWRYLFQHVLSCAKAQALAILQKWGGALQGLLEKGIPGTSFWKECLKRKTEPVIINGKR